MAIGKNKTVTKETIEKAAHNHLPWEPFDKVTSEEIKPGVKKYFLSEECTATVYTEQESCYLMIWGFGIWCKVREGKNGLFLSYPSYKKQDGSYSDLVTCFDKEFNKLINQILEEHFN